MKPNSRVDFHCRKHFYLRTARSEASDFYCLMRARALLEETDPVF